MTNVTDLIATKEDKLLAKSRTCSHDKEFGTEFRIMGVCGTNPEKGLYQYGEIRLFCKSCGIPMKFIQIDNTNGCPTENPMVSDDGYVLRFCIHAGDKLQPKIEQTGLFYWQQSKRGISVYMELPPGSIRDFVSGNIMPIPNHPDSEEKK